MKVVWPCPWFGDYRVPVFSNLNTLLDGGLMVYYSLPEEGSRLGVTDSTHKKMQERLGRNCMGLQPRTFEFGDSSSDMANKSLIIRYQPDLYKRLKEYDPDIVIAEAFGGWSMISVMYALLHRKKLMMFYERTAYVERNSPWWRNLYRKIVGFPVKTFLVNGCLTTDYLRNSLGFKKQEYIEGLMVADSDGLSRDVSLFKSSHEYLLLKDSLGLKSKGVTYLFVGQMVERKGINQLLAAWIEHISAFPNDTLLVLGTGILLEQLRETYGNIQSIKILGKVPYDEIHKYYAISDVFFIPTLEDNWCLVLPEAMSCGMPVASSVYNGGYYELIAQPGGDNFDKYNLKGALINGKNGVAFDPLCKDTLLSALAFFHNVDLKQMGAASREIIKNFTPKIAAEKIANACREFVYGK